MNPMRKVIIILIILISGGLICFLAIQNPKVKRQVIKIRNHLRTEQYEKSVPTGDEVWGIDISHHQKNVNWGRMEAEMPHFLFLKATEGSTHIDTRYTKYKKEAEDLGVPTGAYHFFSYSSDGTIQAEHFLSVAKLKSGNLLPVLDCEFRNNMPNEREVTKQLLLFIRTIEAELNVSPIIYCECSYYNKYLRDEVNGRCPLWISNFYREPPCDYVFWQKTDRFSHPSFRGTVDYNTFQGEPGELNNYVLK